MSKRPRSSWLPSRRYPRIAGWSAAGCLAATLLSLDLRGASPDALAAGLAGTVLIGSTTASNRLEQIYYLGAFDPDNRVPPTFFRVRVRGQASILSNMKFGSGWIPASIADSLNSQVSTAGPISQADRETGIANRPFGARLQQYGPEGFQKVPDTARLAIIMGADPDEFFKLVDAFNESLQIKKDSGANAGQVLLKQKLKAAEDENAAWAQLKEKNGALFK